MYCNGFKNKKALQTASLVACSVLGAGRWWTSSDNDSHVSLWEREQDDVLWDGTAQQRMKQKNSNHQICSMQWSWFFVRFLLGFFVVSFLHKSGTWPTGPTGEIGKYTRSVKLLHRARLRSYSVLFSYSHCAHPATQSKCGGVLLMIIFIFPPDFP